MFAVDENPTVLPALWDLHLLVTHGGRHRTLETYRALPARAGCGWNAWPAPLATDDNLRRAPEQARVEIETLPTPADVAARLAALTR